MPEVTLLNRLGLGRPNQTGIDSLGVFERVPLPWDDRKADFFSWLKHLPQKAQGGGGNSSSASNAAASSSASPDYAAPASSTTSAPNSAPNSSSTSYFKSLFRRRRRSARNKKPLDAMEYVLFANQAKDCELLTKDV